MMEWICSKKTRKKQTMHLATEIEVSHTTKALAVMINYIVS